MSWTIKPLINNSFKEKLKSIQYDVCLALTGAIWDTSKDLSRVRLKIYQI